MSGPDGRSFSIDFRISREIGGGDDGGELSEDLGEELNYHLLSIKSHNIGT